jgi:hypothetical protein
VAVSFIGGENWRKPPTVYLKKEFAINLLQAMSRVKNIQDWCRWFMV